MLIPNAVVHNSHTLTYPWGINRPHPIGLRGAMWTVTLCFSTYAGRLLFGDSSRHTWM